MKRWVFMLALAVYPATARTQSITVDYRQTISVPLPGALAAFSLDDFYVEAKAQDATLTIFGKNSGSAHIVAVVRDGTKTFEVRVLPAPPSYPPGFVQPLPACPQARVAVTNLVTPRLLPNQKISLTLSAARAIDPYGFTWTARFSLPRTRAKVHSA